MTMIDDDFATMMIDDDDGCDDDDDDDDDIAAPNRHSPQLITHHDADLRHKLDHRNLVS